MGKNIKKLFGQRIKETLDDLYKQINNKTDLLNKLFVALPKHFKSNYTIKKTKQFR